MNGQDLAEIDPESWWRALAWVPQSPRLFKGSVEDNLALGLPARDFAGLRNAAARAHAYNFIQSLPGQFGAAIDEGGANISGGETQRLALARAYARQAKLLILDEATASLDAGTEAAILDSMEQGAGVTAIIIAHRLTLAERADQILVLQEGRLVQAGTHASLAAIPGPYRDMLRTREAAYV
ncbi:ATP-binding cassette domain-containing protein [Acidocella sp. MX-AZ03]|nr:ATP-binding cassette domain-containing protein [Acidocella sp. MX-AZ03]WBO58598.1 ATP-binding cassette domain-containing protein [Acidocella sp. MX-AZ03]